MLKKLEFLIVLLTFSFWPLDLYLANTPDNFLKYSIPSVLLILSFVLFASKSSFYPLPILVIPFIEPKLALLPIATISLTWLWNRSERKYILFLIVSLLVFLLNWKPFFGQTIFKPDYEARQEIIGRSYIYPNVFTARLFQNKLRIYISKFNDNFFALIDPNNYFFNFHPREILIDNQNLVKYPFLSIIFMAVGLYYLKKNEYLKFITPLLFGGVLSLSVLTVFDRNDFVLWLPLLLILLYGLTNLKKKSKKKIWLIFIPIFLIFTFIELLRIFVR